jgi:hypothetical protein
MIENTGNKTGAQRGADRDPAQGGEQDLVRGGERNDRDEVGGIEAKCDGSNISVARQQGGAGRMILSPWSGNADVGATAAVEPDASLPTGVPASRSAGDVSEAVGTREKVIGWCVLWRAAGAHLGSPKCRRPCPQSQTCGCAP